MLQTILNLIRNRDALMLPAVPLQVMGDPFELYGVYLRLPARVTGNLPSDRDFDNGSNACSSARDRALAISFLMACRIAPIVGIRAYQ